MISKANKDNLLTQTYENILTMIADGRLKNSAFISHRLLADELKVSKQPVGIALQWLESDGIVESLPRVGTRIKQITAEDVWGIFQWRLALETRIVYLACDYADQADIEQLYQQAATLDKLIGDQSVSLAEIQHNDVEFHIALAEASHCEKLKNELSKLNIYYLKSMLCEAVQMTRENIPSHAAINHSEIVDAISKRDKALACEMIEKHLELSSDMKKFVEWYKENKTN